MPFRLDKNDKWLTLGPKIRYVMWNIVLDNHTCEKDLKILANCLLNYNCVHVWKNNTNAILKGINRNSV